MAANALATVSAPTAEAACRVDRSASISVSWPGFGNVLYGVYPIRIDATPSSASSDGRSTSSTSENCSTNSYTVRVYLNNRLISSNNTSSLNTTVVGDGTYDLRAEISDEYSTSSERRQIVIRNNWVRPEVFEIGYYRAVNPDVSNAFGGDDFKVRSHWLNNGIYEGRRASASFHSVEYLANYGDLQAAFGSNFPAAVDHYITNGLAEGRRGLSTSSGLTQIEGFFESAGTIYYSNGNDAFCGIASWDDFLLMGGRSDSGNVRRRSGTPDAMRYDGACRVNQPEGFFQVNGAGAIYYSNGQNAFCAIDSWETFVRWNGGSGDTSRVRQRGSLPVTMANHGTCR